MAGTRRLSDAAVRERFSQLLENLESCWALLASFKWNATSSPDLISFQPKLAEALFHLERFRDRIYAEKRELIKRKRQLRPQWFLARIKKLDFYLEQFAELANLARSLGDAFVWFFYRENPELLAKHAENTVERMPSGEGGIGELGFIQHAQMFGKCFVLYHGITNLLRLGDVTLVNVESMTPCALGEIKSKRIEGDRFEAGVLFTFFSESGRTEEWLKDQPKSDHSTFSGLDRKSRARLSRQLSRMADFSKIDAELTGTSVETKNYFALLEGVWSDLGNSDFAVQGGSEGVIVMGFLSSPSVYERMLHPTKFKMSTRINRKLLSFLRKYNDSKQPVPEECAGSPVLRHMDVRFTFPGNLPFFWCFSNLEMLHDFYFGKALAFVLVDTSFLFHQLHLKGFAPNVQQGKLVLRRELENGSLEVHNLQFFIEGISRLQMSTDFVICCLEETAGRGQKIAATGQVRVNIHPAVSSDCLV